MKIEGIIKGGSALAGGLVGYLLGGFDMFLSTLVTLMILDYILGVIGGYSTGKLSSATAFKGISKKVAMFCVVAVAYRIDTITGANGAIRGAILFSYIATEGISILENAAMLDAPIPEKLKDALLQLKEGNKKEVK